jgi:hypothetical protein
MIEMRMDYFLPARAVILDKERGEIIARRTTGPAPALRRRASSALHAPRSALISSQ